MTPFRSSHEDFAQLAASPSWSHCEGIIKGFEQSWQAGQTPAIQDHLLTASDIRGALLVELVHIDLEFRLKAEQPARVEDYFGAFPELLADSKVVLDLITAEYDLRRRKERGLSLEDYAARFPTLQPELEDRLFSATRKTIVATSLPSSDAPTAWPEVPDYTLVAQIGRGGMGVVYKAFEPKLDRHVALKFLPAEFAQQSDRLERFLREARTSSALNHPNICTVHALGDHQGRPYIVMEYVEGETLTEIAKRIPAIELVTQWIHQAARALAAAHAAGVVHRDVKPDNIMVRPDGYVKVLDFGLARRLPQITEPARDGARSTTAGALLGTVAYMSPEQTRGATADSASDIFSLGIALYELLAGRHPFVAETSIATLHAIASHAAVPLATVNPAIPTALAGLVEAMLNKDARLRPTAAEVHDALESALDAPTAPRAADARPLVRRETELAQLREAYQLAASGRFHMVCLQGEPGIGKTTLVEDFLAELASSGKTRLIARGHCSERLADAEAYLPVIDALDSLLRHDESGAAARALKLVAPAWFAQVAPCRQDDGAPAPRAGSQQAMMREFCGFMDQASRLATVVLFLDDVHWADVSTVDLLAHLGRQCQHMRVLVLATYRPTEMLLGRHPFRGVQLELQGRGYSTETRLGFLARHEIDDYLGILFENHDFPVDLTDLIYARTEGSPLFMADLVRYLRERGVLAEVEGRWTVARELPNLSREIPESVRGMIERKLDRLEEDERRLLTAAAVLGHEFESLVIADALEEDPAWVEERLQHLADVHGLVRELRPHELPDRSLSVRFAFVHILYQQALYHQLLPTRRAQWSLALASAMQKRHVEAASAVNAELACLYEVGRDYLKASEQFASAAHHAAQLYAHHESATLARRGIKLLDAITVTPQCAAIELRLQTTLGLQLQVTEGYAAPNAEKAYRRGRELCNENTDGALVFPVLWGLWLCNKVRNDLAAAQGVAEELAQLARRLNAPELALQAHQALGMTALCRGDQECALLHVEQAAAIYDPKRHHLNAFRFGQDPGVICKALGAVTLWLLGYPDAAVRQSVQAIRMSESLSPISQAVAYYFAAKVHQLRRDPAETRRCAAKCHEISREHGFSFWLAGSAMLLGWSKATIGSAEDGIAEMRQALHDWHATGSSTYETYFRGILAETILRRGDFATARAWLEESLAIVERTGERLYEAELHRLLGETHLAAGAAGVEEAEVCFRRALHVAQRQNARSPELRAAMDLVRLERSQGNLAPSAAILAKTFQWFTQGLGTPDLQTARTLLEARAAG